MKKIKSALSMAVLGLSMTVTHYASAEDSMAKVIVVGTLAFAKPFVFKENEKLTGFDIDVTQAVAAKAGYQVKFAEYDWRGIFGALDSGRIDTIAYQISVNDVRKQKYYFSQPYSYSNESIIIPADDLTTVSMKDLKGKVGVDVMNSFKAPGTVISPGIT